MSFFKKLTKAIVEVAVTPIDVVKDVATFGGLATDQEKPYTLKRLEDANKSLNEALKSLDEE